MYCFYASPLVFFLAFSILKNLVHFTSSYFTITKLVKSDTIQMKRLSADNLICDNMYSDTHWYVIGTCNLSCDGIRDHVPGA